MSHTQEHFICRTKSHVRAGLLLQMKKFRAGGLRYKATQLWLMKGVAQRCGRTLCSGSPPSPKVPASSRCHLVPLVRWLQCVCVLAGNHEVLFLRMPALLSLCLGKSSSWSFLEGFCFSLKYFSSYIYCVCRGHMQGASAAFSPWRSEGTLQELVLSFHHACMGIKFRWSGSGPRAFVH